MEEPTTQFSPAHPMVDIMPTQQASTANAPMPQKPVRFYHNKKVVWIVAGIVVLVAIGIAVWFIVRHRKAATYAPMQTLQQLENSSQPVTTTPDQRAKTLVEAQKKSIPSKVTTKQQISILNALQK